jgi:hypothetical protein
MRQLLVIFMLFFVLIGQQSCSKDPDFSIDESKIMLVWYKGYPADSLHKSMIGLEWALSYIGAEATQNLYQMQVPNNQVLLDLEQLGFTAHAKEKLKILHHKLKFTEEYRRKGAIDMGRYVALILGASEHYYEFVQMPENLNDLLVKYELDPMAGYVDNSLISSSHRIIRFSDQLGLNQLFVSNEVDPISGEITEFETIDMMPNGQMRYGIFDADGKRINAADPTKTEAGKPAKCMWCHESGIQPLFTEQSTVDGYLTYPQLYDTLYFFRFAQAAKWANLNRGVDYSKTQHHALAELLYITFMEPSAERLSLEWGISVEEVNTKLAGLPRHTHIEYAAFVNLFDREDLIPYEPYQALSVSSNVRNQSAVEVNHLQ